MRTRYRLMILVDWRVVVWWLWHGSGLRIDGNYRNNSGMKFLWRSWLWLGWSGQHRPYVEPSHLLYKIHFDSVLPSALFRSSFQPEFSLSLLFSSAGGTCLACMVIHDLFSANISATDQTSLVDSNKGRQRSAKRRLFIRWWFTYATVRFTNTFLRLSLRIVLIFFFFAFIFYSFSGIFFVIFFLLSLKFPIWILLSFVVSFFLLIFLHVTSVLSVNSSVTYITFVPKLCGTATVSACLSLFLASLAP
jgi:hypothetical protein